MHFTETVLLDTNLEYPVLALQARRIDIGRHCKSVETAQSGIEPLTLAS